MQVFYTAGHNGRIAVDRIYIAFFVATSTTRRDESVNALILHVCTKYTRHAAYIK